MVLSIEKLPCVCIQKPVRSQGRLRVQRPKNPPQEGIDNNKMDDVNTSGLCKGRTNGECTQDFLFNMLDTMKF